MMEKILKDIEKTVNGEKRIFLQRCIGGRGMDEGWG